MDKGALKLEGLDQVLQALDSTTPLVKEAVMQGLEKGGLDIIADAQNNLRNNGSVVTGLLRQSGKVQKTDESTIDVGFFDTTNKNAGYAAAVEYGRRKGKMPPPDELAQWAYKKLRLSAKEAAAAGWGLAKNIAKHGTQPHAFFKPAVDKNKKKILQRAREALNEKIKMKLKTQ